MSMSFEYLPKGYSKYREQVIHEAIKRRKRLGLIVKQQPVDRVKIYPIISMSGYATGRMWLGVDASPLLDLRVADILRAVSEVTDVSRHDLEGPYRLHNMARARQIAYYFMRRYTKLSLPKIGHFMGHRDHSTVLSGLRRVEANPKAFEPWLSAVAARLGLLVERP